MSEFDDLELSAEDLDELRWRYPYGFIDAHDTPQGERCGAGWGPFDPDWCSPYCSCGHTITVDDGQDPADLLPDRLYWVVPVTREPFETPQPCPDQASIIAHGLIMDCWGHRAVMITAAGRDLVLGPSHLDAGGLTRVLTGRLGPDTARAVGSWLMDLWRQHAAPGSLRDQELSRPPTSGGRT